MKKTCLFLISSFFLIFLFSPTKVLARAEECNPSLMTSEPNTRPAPCNVCYITDLLTPSCATSFNVYDHITYLKNEGETIKRNWGGEIQINASQVKIPFVGKESQASEIDYLADYLEGTNEYYDNYSNQNTITNYQGVLRKLTPMGYQDQVKKELIARAEESTIHDYKVKYTDRFCWKASLFVNVADFTIEKIVETLVKALGINKKVHWPDITQYCLYETNPWDWLEKNSIQFAFKFIPSFIIEKAIKDGGIVNLSELKPPPDPNEKDYKEKYLKWKNDEGGLWYHLWQAAPMLSREDTPGKISPYLAPEHKEDEFEIADELATVEKVPHVARLYEGSQIISQTLIPKGKGVEMVKTPSIPETAPPFTCFKENFIYSEDGDHLCCSAITANLKATEEFPNPNYPCPTLKFDPETQEYILSPECLQQVEKEVSRGIGVNAQHPYLDEIWSYTTNTNGGFFNVFRPYSYPTFEDIEAATKLTYSFSDGEVSPAEGLFFFNHLGGVQKAKEWVVNQALWPYEKK